MATPPDGSIPTIRCWAQKDTFCWICKKSTNSNMEFCCDRCKRSFHHYCPRDKNTPQWVKHVPYELKDQVPSLEQSCFVCRHMILCESNYHSSELPTLNLAIRKALDALIAISESKCDNIFTKSPLSLLNYSKWVMNPIWLEWMLSEACANRFKSAEEFFYDIKRIHHNCLIYNKSLTRYISFADILYSEAFKLYSRIKYCYECYLREEDDDSDDNFLNPCLRPHGIVWTKDLQSNMYKIAKIVGFYNPNPIYSLDGGPTVDLVLFGSRLHLKNVPMEDCFVYSDHRPSDEATIAAVDEPEMLSNLNDFYEHKVRIEEKQNSLKAHNSGGICSDPFRSTIWTDLLLNGPRDTKLTFDGLYLVKFSKEKSASDSFTSDKHSLPASSTRSLRQLSRPNYDETTNSDRIFQPNSKNKLPVTSTATKAKIAFKSMSSSFSTPTASFSGRPVAINSELTHELRDKRKLEDAALSSDEDADEWSDDGHHYYYDDGSDPPSSNTNVLRPSLQPNAADGENEQQQTRESGPVQLPNRNTSSNIKHDAELKFSPRDLLELLQLDDDMEFIRRAMQNLCNKGTLPNTSQSTTTGRHCRMCFDTSTFRVNLHQNYCSKDCYMRHMKISSKQK